MSKHQPNRTDSLKIHSSVVRATAHNVSESELLELPDQVLVPDDTIRTRAFQMWEQAGTPDSDGIAYWLDAERELTGR